MMNRLSVILLIISLSVFTDERCVYASELDAGVDQGAGFEIDMDALGDGTAIDIDLNDLNIEITEDESKTESEADTDTITENGQDKDKVAGDDLRKQLEEEMSEAGEDVDRQVAEQERLHKQRVRSLIWKIVIGILIITIFAVGIMSSLKSGKEDRTARAQIKDKENKDGESKKKKRLSNIEILNLDDDDSLNIR